MESLAYLHLAASADVNLNPTFVAPGAYRSAVRRCFSHLDRNRLSASFLIRLLAISANLLLLAIAAQVNAQVLEFGESSLEVTALQRCLVEKGYLNTSTFGYFGDQTEAAVKEFQRERGLTVDGIVGSQTAAALGCNLVTNTNRLPAISSYPPTPFYAPDYTRNRPAVPANAYTTQTRPTLSRGDRGAAVEELQKRLQRQRLYVGEIDGIFGPATQAAVSQFQRANNLQVDGVVGSTTWTALGVKGGGSQSDRLATKFGVEALQRQLADQGFYAGAIDGRMGPETERAIAKAQQYYGVTHSEILTGRLPR